MILPVFVQCYDECVPGFRVIIFYFPLFLQQPIFMSCLYTRLTNKALNTYVYP